MYSIGMIISHTRKPIYIYVQYWCDYFSHKKALYMYSIGMIISHTRKPYICTVLV